MWKPKKEEFEERPLTDGICYIVLFCIDSSATAAEFYDGTGNPPKKYSTSHQSLNFIQTSAAEFFSDELMTPLDAHVHLFIALLCSIQGLN